MKAIEIINILKENNKTISNVLITSNNDKLFKQKLRINNTDILYIGNYNSKYPNYRIGDSVTENWKNVKLIK